MEVDLSGVVHAQPLGLAGLVAAHHPTYTCPKNPLQVPGGGVCKAAARPREQKTSKALACEYGLVTMSGRRWVLHTFCQVGLLLQARGSCLVGVAWW